MSNGRDKEDIHCWFKAKVKVMCGYGISVVDGKAGTAVELGWIRKWACRTYGRYGEADWRASKWFPSVDYGQSGREHDHCCEPGAGFLRDYNPGDKWNFGSSPCATGQRTGDH